MAGCRGSLILVVANDHATIANFRSELLVRLIAEGGKVTVAVPAHERNHELDGLGCQVRELPLSRFGTNPFAELVTFLRIMRLISREAPDAVLTYTVKPNIYGGLAAQLNAVPYIITVTGLGSVFQRRGTLQHVSALLQRLAYRQAVRVFFQNEGNAQEFRNRRVVGTSTEVLPGSGVNLSANSLIPYPPDGQRIRMLTVSRIRRDKGFDELFESIRTICSTRDDVEFHIVGEFEDQEYRETIAELSKELPLVFHGAVSQERVREIVGACHALVHPSHHEGMANAVLEAAAIGRPCLVADIPGCREAVVPGRTGLIFRPRDSGSLVMALHNFLKLSWQQRQAMGLAGRAKMEAEFDRDSVVAHYLQAIQEAIGRAPSGRPSPIDAEQ